MIVWSQTPVLVPPTLDLTAQVVQSCTQRYEDPAAPDAITRAYTDTAKVELSAKNPSDEEVLLVGMRVDVLHRAGPPTSGRYRRVWCRWITPLTTRYVVFDLDEPEPLVTGGRFAPRARVGPNLPPPRSAGFPYQISRLDPEYFEVSFRAKRCDCTFLIVLDWVVGGGRRQSTTTPFRVVPKVPSLIA
ncbi:hypothetical protein LFM09_22695 [Lentzea alba]|uniref:hypothetical protein n=1 Tax=Lentzea alba TaxID=2714351 RepID=UPI0039BF683A